MSTEPERLRDVINCAKGFLNSSRLFAERERLKDAEEYMMAIARNTGQAPYVITACMVYARTLVATLLRAAEVPEEEIAECCGLFAVAGQPGEKGD